MNKIREVGLYTSASGKHRAVILVAIIASVGLIVLKAIRSDWTETLHFVQYVVPAIIFAAMLVAHRFAGNRAIPYLKFSFDFMTVAIAASRMVITTTPFSGHMVLFVYGLIAAGRMWLRLVALALLIHTTVLKLFFWSDSSTWAFGLGIGAIVGIACLACTRTPAKLPTTSMTDNAPYRSC